MAHTDLHKDLSYISATVRVKNFGYSMVNLLFILFQHYTTTVRRRFKKESQLSFSKDSTWFCVEEEKKGIFSQKAWWDYMQMWLRRHKIQSRLEHWILASYLLGILWEWTLAILNNSNALSAESQSKLMQWHLNLICLFFFLKLFKGEESMHKQ